MMCTTLQGSELRVGGYVVVTMPDVHSDMVDSIHGHWAVGEVLELPVTTEPHGATQKLRLWGSDT